MLPQKTGAARAEEARRGLHREPLCPQRAAGLPTDQANAQRAVLPQRPRPASRSAQPDARDRANPGALWVSAYPRVAQAGRLATRQESDVSTLLRGTATVAFEAAEAPQDGGGAPRTASAEGFERCLEPRLRILSAR